MTDTASRNAALVARGLKHLWHHCAQMRDHGRLAPLRSHPHVADVRQAGMIAAVELVFERATRKPCAAAERRDLGVYLHGLKHGVLLSPVGNIVYFMPPYVITEAEIDQMVDVTPSGIDLAVKD